MEAATLSPARPPAAPPPLLDGAAARASALLAAHGARLHRIARRHAPTATDADDALQQAAEILLTRGPDIEPSHLLAWMTVVTRREALRMRRRGPLWGDPTAGDEPTAELDPYTEVSRREAVSEAAARLARLKPDERTALALQAAGYSYAEIGAMKNWTYTKVNRCIAEGRAALRRSEEQPVSASRFCDPSRVACDR